MSLNSSVFNFLKKIKANNNREWFKENKDDYIRCSNQIIQLNDLILEELKKHDNIETISGKKALHRIYRDIRFSKDKTPYKIHFGTSFKRTKPYLRGGYYIHLEPSNSFIAGGYWGPNSADLKKLRNDISSDPDEIQSIISNPVFIETFGNLIGEKLKTAPRGIDKNHAQIELLRLKQYLLIHKLSDNEIFQENFHIRVNEVFMKMRPFLDYTSMVLTSDENGVPLEL